jgi:hypothetical protein
MSDAILRLSFFYFEDYIKIPPCRLCGADYKVIRKYYKRERTPGGGYLFNFASPEKGYEDGDEVYISKKQLTENDINPDLERLDAWQAVKLFQMVFDEDKYEDEKENPDVRIRWSRLRAFLTKKYQHPEPKGDNVCRNATERGGEKFRTEGPPATIYQWAEPLFVALYALGMSPREIAGASSSQLGIHEEVYQSVSRQINKYKETATEPEREELERLHEWNRRKYNCVWDNPQETRGITWEVTMHPKQGELDPETAQWLKKLAAHHMKYLKFELKDIPIDPIELLTTSPIPNI